MKGFLVWFITWRYTVNGLLWGCHQSYAMWVDEPNPHTADLGRWCRRYVKLGFKPVPSDVWVAAGGFEADYESSLFVEQGQIEI